MTPNRVPRLAGEHKVPWIWCHKLKDAMEKWKKWINEVLGKY